MQTSEPGAFPTQSLKGAAIMNKEGGTGVFFKGLQPLWAR
jgi:hypothetical protein